MSSSAVCSPTSFSSVRHLPNPRNGENREEHAENTVRANPCFVRLPCSRRNILWASRWHPRFLVEENRLEISFQALCRPIDVSQHNDDVAIFRIPQDPRKVISREVAAHLRHRAARTGLVRRYLGHEPSVGPVVHFGLENLIANILRQYTIFRKRLVPAKQIFDRG